MPTNLDYLTTTTNLAGLLLVNTKSLHQLLCFNGLFLQFRSKSCELSLPLQRREEVALPVPRSLFRTYLHVGDKFIGLQQLLQSSGYASTISNQLSVSEMKKPYTCM